MNYLEKYKTGNRVPITLVLRSRGEEQRVASTGFEYSAGLGTLIVRLHELLELRRKKSTWLYRFFNGRFGTLSIDEEIKTITTAIDYVNIVWSDYR